ncbi:MAG: hypothetical protein U0840_21475 [Gemmataceae bacterium]
MNIASTIALLSLAVAPPVASPFFTIRVIDEVTGRGVPLVELRTVSGIRLWTDSAGYAVFDEPGQLGTRVWFGVSSPGYELTPDGFGIRGRAFDTACGKTGIITLQRKQIAERLYRVTGGGIYRDSLLAGQAIPLREGLLNGQVVGQDSVLTAVYRGKVHWVWGDTSRPSYPLGNFQVAGATSLLPGQGGLSPARGVDLTYFVDAKGFARQMAPMPGSGPTWITSLFVLPDERNQERLVASYIKVKPPLTAYARGLAVFDDKKGVYEKLADLTFTAPAHPTGHAIAHEGYLYFAQPYPLTRVKANLQAVRDATAYEGYSCLGEDGKVERDATGKVVYRWRKNTAPIGPVEQNQLVRRGLLKEQEGLLQLRDRNTGRRVLAHSGSVYWNAYRQRWVMVAVEAGGKASYLGEVWYAEAAALTGPWAYAVQVATHPKYSFYNPKQHPQFDEADGRVIYLEGTYTHTFSGNDDVTPRYDYNQLMYRLDLGDERLALPVAVQQGKEFLGFALDRPVRDSAPFQVGGRTYYALKAREAPAVTRPLFEYPPKGDEPRRLSLDPHLPSRTRTPEPVGHIWPDPWAERGSQPTGRPAPR